MPRPAIFGALALVMIAIAGFTQLSVSAADVAVDAGNVYFCAPSFEGSSCETDVVAGDTVTWTVSAGFHTVTECDLDHTNCGGTGHFDSGQMELGDTFAQTFDTPGSYAYYCAFHPSQMRGVIVVSVPTPSPTPSPTRTPSDNGVIFPTATPVSVPKTGGPPAGDGADFAMYALFAGGLAVLGASGLAFAVARRG